MLKSAKLNFDIFCRMVDRLSAGMELQVEALVRFDWNEGCREQ
jgi:hypothetical protein